MLISDSAPFFVIGLWSVFLQRVAASEVQERAFSKDKKTITSVFAPENKLISAKLLVGKIFPG